MSMKPGPNPWKFKNLIVKKDMHTVNAGNKQKS